MMTFTDALAIMKKDEEEERNWRSARSKLTELLTTCLNAHDEWVGKSAQVEALDRTIQMKMRLCDSWPAPLRQGIDGWDWLTPPIWKDGRSLDLMQRGALVSGIRAALMTGGRWQENLENLQRQIDRGIGESGWPAVPVA